jgi:hypothetical protein
VHYLHFCISFNNYFTIHAVRPLIAYMQWHILCISNERQFQNIYTQAQTHTHIYIHIHHKVLQTDILHLPLPTANSTAPGALSQVKGKSADHAAIKGYTDHVIPPPNWISTRWTELNAPFLRPLLWSSHGAHGEFEVVAEMITIADYFATILPMCTLSKYNRVVTLIKIS